MPEARSASTASDESRTLPVIDHGLVKAHTIAALVMLLASVVFGILVSLQFIAPDLLSDWLPSWGRLRYAHTQGIMFGWLGNAFIAFLYHGVPLLTGRPVTARPLGYVLFAIWNFMVMLPGWVLVLAGISQPLEWAEFPLVVDAFVMLALLLAGVQFLPGFFRHGFENLYVSSWYVIGGLVFTVLSYPMGNLVPEFVPGAAGAAFSGLWIHDAVGLFVTPMALAILYYVVPASTGRPIFSHFLSMLGFWGLFFLYPLNGIHHYIHSAIPMDAQFTAILASFLLGVVVIIVVSNLMLSQRGAGLIPREPALRFASMSVVFYLVVSLQGSVQAGMHLNQHIHFTDWVIGHSHLAMLGFATFAGIAGIVHAWQRIPGARFNPRLIDYAYWLLVSGITVMVLDLTLAGLVQGAAWENGAPWLDSIRESRAYWLIRTLSAIPITLGFAALLAGLLTPAPAEATHRGPRTAVSPDEDVSHPVAAGLRMSYLAASLAGVGFFVLSVSVLGVLTLRSLEAEVAALAPPGILPLTSEEARGREIYAREGCAYCHTQQVRYTDSDRQRFGAPSLAWEGRQDIPHLLGTRRIGPDLARTYSTRSHQWQLAHLFAPRAVVPDSVMPAYPQFFMGSPEQPTREALDLLAYLESLGRERALGWPETDRAAAAQTQDERALSTLQSPILMAHPGQARRRGDAPSLPAASADAAGQSLWENHCAGCHGSTGQGDGPAATWLQPAPVDLTQHRYRPDLLADILWNGVYGASMPAWRDLAVEDLSRLVAVVRTFSTTDPTPGPAAAIAEGASVYQTHCAECHGERGQGDGFAAANLPIPIPPTDFTREQLSLSASLRVLRDGIPGTSMAPWGDRLSAAEMEAVSHYLRSLFTESRP